MTQPEVCELGRIDDGTLRVCCEAHGRVLCAGHYALTHFVETDHSPTCVERIEAAMQDVTVDSIGPGAFDCYENAEPDEPMFVLLGRDRDAPRLVEEWAESRERRIGPPLPAAVIEREEAKVAEARECAAAMRRFTTGQNTTGPAA